MGQLMQLAVHQGEEPIDGGAVPAVDRLEQQGELAQLRRSNRAFRRRNRRRLIIHIPVARNCGISIPRTAVSRDSLLNPGNYVAWAPPCARSHLALVSLSMRSERERQSDIVERRVRGLVGTAGQGTGPPAGEPWSVGGGPD